MTAKAALTAPPGTTVLPQSTQTTVLPQSAQTRLRKSRKALIIATLRIFFYLWEAGKIVFRKKSRLHGPCDCDAKTECYRCLEKSRFRSTWSSLWNAMVHGRVQKRNWKMMMKLKQAYKKMNDQFAFYTKFTGHLYKVNALKGALKKPWLLLKNRRKREIQGSKCSSNRPVPFVSKFLQVFKILRIPRKCITWGEMVHSRDERHQAVIKQYNRRLLLYRKLPLRQMSRLWGRFNDLELPMWLRSPALRLYIWMFNCHLEEAAVQDLKQYPSVGKFFLRHLRPGVRPIDRMPLTSPCDGTVLHCGVVMNNSLEQVKGVTYSVEGFLGPLDHDISPLEHSDGASLDILLNTEDMEEVDYSRCLLNSSTNRLYQCIIYLAPGDYHRFHSPTDWIIHHRRHFPGELFSVNPRIAKWLQGLFSFNERVVYSGRWRHGYMSMTPVGATNVGSIHIYHDQELSTNVGHSWPNGCYYDKSFNNDGKVGGVRMAKGEIFGHFSLGSTIVLLFEAPHDFNFNVKPGEKVKFGQGIGSHKNNSFKYRENVKCRQRSRKQNIHKGCRIKA